MKLLAIYQNVKSFKESLAIAHIASQYCEQAEIAEKECAALVDDTAKEGLGFFCVFW